MRDDTAAIAFHLTVGQVVCISLLLASALLFFLSALESKRVPQTTEPMRNPALGNVCSVVGFALVVVGLLGFRGRGLFASDLQVFAFGLGLAGIGIGGVFLLRGKQLRAVSAPVLMAHDPIPPVVYLRSFADDRQPLWKIFEGVNGGVTETDEELLKEVLTPVGPVIAIGRPGEDFQPPGAARFYVGDQDWQDIVTNLVTHAVLVVVRAGSSAGLWWEISHLVQHVEPRRVVFFFPARTFPVQRRRAYREFRERANQLLPSPLPQDLGKAIFVTFDTEWRPILLGPQSVPWLPRLLFRLREKLPFYSELLHPVFVANGFPFPHWRPDKGTWATLAFFGAVFAAVFGVLVWVGSLLLPFLFAGTQ